MTEKEYVSQVSLRVSWPSYVLCVTTSKHASYQFLFDRQKATYVCPALGWTAKVVEDHNGRDVRFYPAVKHCRFPEFFKGRKVVYWIIQDTEQVRPPLMNHVGHTWTKNIHPN